MWSLAGCPSAFITADTLSHQELRLTADDQIHPSFDGEEQQHPRCMEWKLQPSSSNEGKSLPFYTWVRCQDRLGFQYSWILEENRINNWWMHSPVRSTMHQTQHLAAQRIQKSSSNPVQVIELEATNWSLYFLQNTKDLHLLKTSEGVG